MAQIHLSLKPTSLQCPTLEKLNLTINSPLKEGFISNHSLCLATCPLMLIKTIEERREKKLFVTLYARLFVYSTSIQHSVPSQTWWRCQI